MPVSEQGLIRRAASGGGKAFEDLFRTHFAAVYNYALLLAGEPVEAEDLTQEAFVRAHASLYGHIHRLSAWPRGRASAGMLRM